MKKKLNKKSNIIILIFITILVLFFSLKDNFKETLTQIFAILCMFTMGLFNDNIMDLFVSNNLISVATIKSIIYIAIVIYSAILLIGYFVNLKLFNRGVNVD